MKTIPQIVDQVNKIKGKLMIRVLSNKYSTVQTVRFANFCTKYRYIKHSLEQLDTF